MSAAAPAQGGNPYRWSWEFGRYFGISLRIHVSFAILLGWLALATYSNSGSVIAALYSVTVLSALFACVAMHEYGHALMARRFGIGTREITLFPIGGIAQLERIPDEPAKEFWIAVAGPAVNVALALLCAALIWLEHGTFTPIYDEGWMNAAILPTLLRVNVVMALFNMLPALPMDGGRVLRALLALRMPNLQATRLSTRIAKVLSGGMILLGVLSGNLLLSIIGLFVWMASNAEYQRVVMEEVYRRAFQPGRPARSFWAGQAAPPNEWVNPPPGSPPRSTKPGFDRRG